MKNIVRFLVVSAMLVSLGLPALVKGNSELSISQSPQDADAKAKIYERFRTNFKTDQKAAYEAGKEYLAKYPNDTDEIAKYVRKWIDAYEKGSKRIELDAQRDQLLKDKKFNEAFATGKQILADDPNDLTTLYTLAWNGLFALTSGNTSINADATDYAKRAIQLLESGKNFQEGTTLSAKDREDSLGRLNYALGFYTVKSAPAAAVTYLTKAAQLESFAKKDPQTYSLLAVAYQANQYDSLRKDFEARCKTDATTPDCKALSQNIDQVIDRVIDAYARAVAFSGTDAKFQQRKAEWMQQLTSFYKYRHENSDKGLNELLAAITSQPLPAPPTMVTVPAPSTTPTSAPATQPAAGGTPAGKTGTSSPPSKPPRPVEGSGSGKALSSSRPNFR